MTVVRGQPPVSKDPERWRRLKKAMHIAKSPSVDLDDDDRRDLAKILYGVDADDPNAGSWSKLNEEQLDQLLWMLEGFVYITYLKSQKG